MQEAGWEIASHGLRWIDYQYMEREEERRQIARGDPHPHRGHRRAAARLVHRAGPARTRLRARRRGRRLPLRRRLLRRRPALLGRGRRQAAADRALHARRQRHALRHPGRASTRATSSSPTSRTASTCSTPEGRRGAAEDDVGRPALPAGRPPGPCRGPGALPRLCRRRTSRSGSAAAIDIARHWHEHHAAVSRPLPPLARPRGVRRHLRPRLRAFALDRRGGLGRRPAGGCRHGRGPAPRPVRRPGARTRRAQARPDPGPPRPRRQARPGRPAHRRIDQRAGLGRARPADRRGARDLHRASTTPTTARFGFPFIIAVKGLSKAEILAAFERRLNNDRDTELATALAQVERIALLRLKDLLP